MCRFPGQKLVGRYFLLCFHVLRDDAQHCLVDVSVTTAGRRVSISSACIRSLPSGASLDLRVPACEQAPSSPHLPPCLRPSRRSARRSWLHCDPSLPPSCHQTHPFPSPAGRRVHPSSFKGVAGTSHTPGTELPGIQGGVKRGVCPHGGRTGLAAGHQAHWSATCAWGRGARAGLTRVISLASPRTASQRIRGEH